MKNLYLAITLFLLSCWEMLTTPSHVTRHVGLRYGVKNDAVSTQGFLCEISEDDGATWLEVAQLTDIVDPSQEASDLDATNLQSAAKEYINGLQDSQSVTITGQRVVLSEGQNLIRDNAGGPGTFSFRNTYSDGAILTYSATLKKFGVTGSVDAVMMFTATIRPSGEEVWSGTGGPVT